MYKVYGFVIDGDGLTHRSTLTFESKDHATDAGIRLSSWDNEYT